MEDCDFFLLRRSGWDFMESDATFRVGDNCISATSSSRRWTFAARRILLLLDNKTGTAAMTQIGSQCRPMDNWQRLYKRLSDLVIGITVIIILLPLLSIVAIVIKLDSPGPVLFTQPRRGYNNQKFPILKFRTMEVNLSDVLAERQTSRDDPRVTRVGRWLRKLSIDELPQLLNVLRGEMSIVGPRPHTPQTRIEGETLDQVLVEYLKRYQVKPGITGWAQVNGARGELVKRDDLRRRLAYDLEYIQRWSIGFDLKIIALTVTREIISKHAF